MRLIGMPDSPYVRRVGVSMTFMGLPFTHEPVSVFRHFEAFAAINPVVKAPSLVLDDGTVLMDSTLILDHVERLAPPERRLTPTAIGDHARSQRLIGLALAACEKTVQIVYEHQLRPSEKQHQPWLNRVHGQLLAAYGLLEAEIGGGDGWLLGERPMQVDITAAVAWTFTRNMVPDLMPEGYPALARLTDRMEARPEFLAVPFN